MHNTFQTNNARLLQNHVLSHDTVGFAFGETSLRNMTLSPELLAVRIADKMKIKMYFIYKKDSSKEQLIHSFWKILQENDF